MISGAVPVGHCETLGQYPRTRNKYLRLQKQSNVLKNSCKLLAFFDFNCVYRSLIHAPRFFFGIASPAHSLPFALSRPGIPAVSCSMLCALARYLFSLTCCFLPLSLSLLFCSLRCIVLQTPPFGLPSFRPRQESGLGSSGWLRCGVSRIFLSGYVGVSRTQGHP